MSTPIELPKRPRPLCFHVDHPPTDPDFDVDGMYCDWEKATAYMDALESHRNTLESELHLLDSQLATANARVQELEGELCETRQLQIEEMDLCERAREAAEAALSAELAKHEWIGVEDDLAPSDRTHERRYRWRRNEGLTITHWRPLPALPTEEEA